MIITNWIEIQSRSKTKRNECSKDVIRNSFWSNSTRVARILSWDKMNNHVNKISPALQDIIETAHEFVKRESVNELQCIVCGKNTGCNECEY